MIIRNRTTKFFSLKPMVVQFLFITFASSFIK